MAIITISHQIGSGGREIGQAVAQKLGMDYVDREIVAGVARKLGISEEMAFDMDEKAQGLVARLLSVFNVGSTYMIAPTFEQAELPPDEKEYQDATRKTIEAAAASNRAVIAGHGANMALAGKHGVLHVYIYAPKEQRTATLMARDGIGKAEGVQKMQENDRDRAQYIKTFYNAHWQDPLNYHLMINTAVVKPDLAVELISQALRTGSI